MKFTPHSYQRDAINWILNHERCGLFLDMGLGKTAITLTAIARMIDCCEIERVLIIAPKTVAGSTWPAELSRWDHLAGLKMTVADGGPHHRSWMLQDYSADIHVVSRDNFVWMASEIGFATGVWSKERPKYDMLVIDELSSFRTPDSLRFKALKKALPYFKRVIGLTGTPAPNGLMNLWSEIYALDQGERLGKNITQYRQKYFTWRVWNNIAIDYRLRPGAREDIMGRISDICLSMKAEDYLTLPPLNIIDSVVKMFDEPIQGYEYFQRDAVMELEGAEVTADSAAALCNKLSQYANGAVYIDKEHNYKETHTAKLVRLAEIVEGAASPVLVFYQFKSDAARIKDYFAKKSKKLRVKSYEGNADLEEWNAGNIDVLLAHPASTAYGLNMQAGGHYAAWFGTGWNLELYTQANARLYRQGQKHPVFIYNIIAEGTVDERALAALRAKEETQSALMKAVAALRRECCK